jgi:hypothetical protein
VALSGQTTAGLGGIHLNLGGNAQTQTEMRASILDWLHASLPRPPFTEGESELLAPRIRDGRLARSQVINATANVGTKGRLHG